MHKAIPTLIGWIVLLSLLFLGGCAEPPYTNLSNQQLKELMVKLDLLSRMLVTLPCR